MILRDAHCVVASGERLAAHRCVGSCELVLSSLGRDARRQGLGHHVAVAVEQLHQYAVDSGLTIVGDAVAVVIAPHQVSDAVGRRLYKAKVELE